MRIFTAVEFVSLTGSRVNLPWRFLLRIWAWGVCSAPEGAEGTMVLNDRKPVRGATEVKSDAPHKRDCKAILTNLAFLAA
jgi:hypothetical protein